MTNPLNIALCPGCAMRINRRLHICKNCGYEFGTEPYHALTLQEMLDGKIAHGTYNDVYLEAYTRQVLKLAFIYAARKYHGFIE